MINNITFKNVKGTTRNEALAPFTIITGDNFSGKTAFANAIVLGLLGYVPELGKTNGATFQIASDSKMEVGLTTDKGAWTRAWTQAGKTIKGTENLPEGIDDAALARLLPIFSPAAFIGANDKTRLAMIASATGHSAGAELTEKVLAKMLASTLDHQGAPAVKAFPDPFAYATAVADWAKAMQASAKVLKTRYEQTLQGLTTMDNEAAAPKPKGRQYDTLVEALGKTRTKLAVARERMERLEEKAAAAQSAAEELATLGVPGGDEIKAAKDKARELDKDIAKAAAEAKAHETEGTALGRELAIMRTSLANLERQHGTDLDVKALGQQVDALEAIEVVDLVPYQKALYQAQQAKSVADGNMTAASSMHGRAHKALADFDGLECCPVCKASAEGWKDTVKASLVEREHETEAERKKAAAEVATTGEALQKASYALSTAQRQNDQRAELDKVLAKMNAATTMARLRIDIAEKEGRRQAADEKATLAYQEEAQLQQEREDPADIVARAEAMGELQQRASAHPPLADIDAAREEVTELEGKEVELTTEVTEAKAAREVVAVAEQRARDAQQAREQAEKATTDITEAKRLEEEVREEMEKAMADAFKPVGDMAATFSKGVLDRPLALKEGELGSYARGGWVPFAALSGTEQLVGAATIQAALGARAGGLVVLDELSRMTAKRKEAFADNLAEALVAGTIQQVILLDHDSTFWAKYRDTNLFNIQHTVIAA